MVYLIEFRIDGSTEDGGNAMLGVTCKSSNTPINVTSLLAEVMMVTKLQY